MSTKAPQSDSYSEEEIERRMNRAVRRALNTPPQPKVRPIIAPKRGAASKRGKRTQAGAAS
jgi:hypothetical protein